MASMDTHNKNTYLEQLSQLSIFKGLSKQALQEFVDQCTSVDCKRGTVLEQPGTTSQHFLIVVKGEANAFINALDSLPVMRVGPGQVIGESILLQGEPSPASVVSETEMHLLKVPPEVLQACIAEQHSVACNMIVELIERLRAGSKAIFHSQILQRQYQNDANIDALTGLYNRRWINTFFKRRLSRAVDSHEFPDMSVVLIDADHFKQFNDDYGHYIGDFALKAIAGAICENIRPTDMAARYGGEEFMLILPNTSWEEAEVVAQRVREGVLQKSIEINGSLYPSTSISSGITQAKSHAQLSDVIVSADNALYQAKAAGRNCVKVDEKLKQSG